MVSQIEAVMPRYFFHRTDGTVDNDEDGTELPNLAQARLEALKFAGRTLAEDPNWVWNGQEFRVEVTDESGAVLFTVVTLTVEAQRKRKAKT